MNRNDVLMVNQSFDRLGDALLKNRMMAQQADERRASQDIAQQRTNIDQQRADQESAYRTGRATAEDQHWKNIEDATKLGATFKQVAEHSAMLKNSFSDLGTQVYNGTLSNDDANLFVMETVNGLPEEIRNQISNQPNLRAIAANKFDWAAAGKPKATTSRPAAGVQLDQQAAELEAQADAESDPATAEIFRERAAQLRRAMHAPDPTALATESNVVERDDLGRPVRTVTRKMPVTVASKPLPLPATQSDLVKGKQYITKRGVATWDGTKFVTGQ